MVLGGLIVSTAQRAANTVPPLRHFGEEKREANVAGGWYRYQFPDLGMSLELPREPRTSQLQFRRANPTSRFSGWAFYTVRSPYLYVDITAYRYAPGFHTTLSQDRTTVISNLKERYLTLKTVKQDSTKVDGENAERIDVAYSEPSRGDSDAVVYCFKHSGLTLFMRAIYWDRDKATGLADADRLFRSIHLTEPLP